MNSEKIKVLVESGLLVGVLSLAFWVGASAKTIDVNTKDIAGIQDEQKVLAKDLVETQKDIIRKLTRIETLMDK